MELFESLFDATSSGGPKETLIVTPLMDFVRQKRAAKVGSQVHFLS